MLVQYLNYNKVFNDIRIVELRQKKRREFNDRLVLVNKVNVRYKIGSRQKGINDFLASKIDWALI